MSKFQKLAQLNFDIQLLENAGKIKAADILHKKFIREAQTTSKFPDDSPPGQVQNVISGPRDYNALLNEISMNAHNSNFDQLYQEYKNNLSKYPADEQSFLTTAVNRALKYRQSQGILPPAGATAPAITSGPTSYVANSGVTVTIPGQTTAPDANINSAATQGALGFSQPTEFKFENTGQSYNPEGYSGPAVGEQAGYVQQPTTYSYPNTSDAYNPEGYNGPVSSNISAESSQSNPNPPRLSPEQQRELYFENTKKQSKDEDSSAARKRMLPKIYNSLRYLDIDTANKYFADYQFDLYTKERIDIARYLRDLTPDNYGLNRSSYFVVEASNAFKSNDKGLLKTLLRKKSIYGFEENDYRPDNFINNLIKISEELYDDRY